MANEYKIINKKHAELHITGNKNEGIILIDSEDIPLLKQRSWFIKDGNPNMYVAGKMNNKTIKLHRFIMGVTDRKQIIDHIDRNTFNNRKENLRITDSSTNNLNTSFSKNNVSGRTGVYIIKGRQGKSDRWAATYQIKGKRALRTFSIKKYGYDEAFKMATKIREQFETENNVLTEKTR